MRHHRFASPCLLLSCITAAVMSPACGEDPPLPTPAEEITQSRGMKLTVDIIGDTDVAGFIFTVIQDTCSGQSIPNPVSIPPITVDLEDVVVPPIGGEHVFADVFFDLPPGCYDVMAQPITLAGANSQDCSLATAPDVEVLSGQTTEALLISQCNGDVALGSLDALAALNLPPTYEGLSFTPDKHVPHCQPQTVCATFSDPNKNQLEIVWQQISGIPLDNFPPQNPTRTTNPDDSITECVQIDHAGVGEVGLVATAYDLIRDPSTGSYLRVEDFLAQRGTPFPSHAAHSFPSRGVPSSACPCSLAPHPEICDGYDNDCDGAADEGLQSCGSQPSPPPPFSTFCPQQDRIWHFGNGAGLDFTGGAPAAISSPVSTGEGSAVLSCGGTVRLSTDGMTVYDASSNPMPNGTGLIASPSTTQSSLIVPRPGSQEMVVFTLMDLGSTGELSYSVVDMTLNGGLGDVDPQRKNVTLSPGTAFTEKMTSVRHANGVDTWVIVHVYGTDEFQAYLVSAQGVTGPVSSFAGPAYNFWEGWGQLKASPDGNLLASPTNSALELYSFNRATGQASGLISPAAPCMFYGVEFSPNGGQLYGSCYYGGAVYQYSLATLTEAAITASEIQLGQLPNGGSMQRGPDGRIYIASSQNELSTIAQPNVAGPGAGFMPGSVPLTASSLLGLPNVLFGSY